MATEFHVRVQQVLEEAVRLAPDICGRFIERACAGDADLLREVQSLLPHYEAVGDFQPERPRGSVFRLPGTTTFTNVADAEAPDAEWTPPFAIVPYTVVQVIGRGGMGVVYRAVHPTLHRSVAIKVLRRRLVSREDRRRFKFEEEVLRQLQHPGIARFLHGGIARVVHPGPTPLPPDRRPYFVMEYVAGLPLTRYCESNGLDTRSRLALLVKVCEALEYAHQRGIVHRDLKPDNVLVDEYGQPKILDFGIARVCALESALVQDRDGQFAGTLEYASPEQRAGKVKQLTPVSDVYTLGLLAHELLAGRLPRRTGGSVELDLKGVVLDDELVRRPTLEREFRYYLTVVLATALRKTGRAQYRSAGELGADLEHLLDHHPALSGWPRLKRRLSNLLSPHMRSGPSFLSRPLSAVLRKRIEMAVESEDRRPPTSD